MPHALFQIKRSAERNHEYEYVDEQGFRVVMAHSRKGATPIPHCRLRNEETPLLIEASSFGAQSAQQTETFSPADWLGRLAGIASDPHYTCQCVPYATCYTPLPRHNADLPRQERANPYTAGVTKDHDARWTTLSKPLNHKNGCQTKE